ncbi:MAG: GH25 family lysozyme [Leptospiraceae bacterium]|nr:GH25 family lysozyme [Leptospiraceae bacterium]
MKFFKFILALSILILISLLLFFFFKTKEPNFIAQKNESIAIPKEYKIQGIDVSHYQGKINWKNIKPQGIRFVYMKATQGISFQDKRFHYNWQEAKKYKIPYGAYHFFDLCKKASSQAKNFIRTVAKDNKMLPPVVDLELFKNCANPPEREEFLKELQIFVDKLEAHYKKRPMLYVIWDVFEKYLIGEMKDYSLWISDPWKHTEPAIPEKRDWVLWQYTYEGKVKGISGHVDWNYFNGDETEFTHWINQ